MTLHLNLKKKWYDMIAIGEKREEYREVNKYWTTRLFNKYYEYVCFHLGYTTTTLTFQFNGITKGYGREDWGGSCAREHYIIKIGRRVDTD